MVFGFLLCRYYFQFGLVDLRYFVFYVRVVVDRDGRELQFYWKRYQLGFLWVVFYFLVFLGFILVRFAGLGQI